MKLITSNKTFAVAMMAVLLLFISEIAPAQTGDDFRDLFQTMEAMKNHYSVAVGFENDLVSCPVNKWQ